MSNEPVVRCWACQSEHVLLGRLRSFHLHDAKIFSLALSRPEISCFEEAYVCLHCGLVWSFLDLQELRQKVKSWGGGRLKAQIQAWEETPRQMLLRPAGEGQSSSGAELLRPATTEGTGEEAPYE